jgi:asparagine synthase (glutamine-hydrolysing)
MCGISGVFHYAGGRPDLATVTLQRDVQRHRGPDDEGLWSDGDVALAHRRLAILDLSPGGHQPMANEDGSVWVVYNGEIYDWPRLRADLVARGHAFRGSSDTEALLHLYEEHGPGLVSRLRGMFAFGLFDRARRRLVLGRDRFGVKPLYYHDDGRRLAFASELKALALDPSVPREVDERALADYLTHGHVPAPRSIWRGVRKLPPAHVLVCDAAGARLERYWSLPDDVESGRPLAHHRERLLELLEEAVRIRLLSDVPLGAFLSGGIDSSAVVAMMRRLGADPIRTFAIGFEDQAASELEHAREVARHLGTEHHELVVRPHALELLPRLVWHLDEPFADASMIPTWHVAAMARRHVTVALSGDGGDEGFGGYSTYAWAARYAAADRVPAALRRLAAAPAALLPPDHPLGRKLRRLGLSVVARHLDVEAVHPPRLLPSVLSAPLRAALGDHDPMAGMTALHARAARALGEVPALLRLDAATYMIDDVMVKVDRTSMAHSLEAREPLLDHVLQEHVARIPFEHKLRGGVGKWILRESLRGLLPESILARPKHGFGVPLERWFEGGFDRLTREVLLDPRARRRGWLDPRALERLVTRPGSPGPHRTRRLWALVCLELWAQTYVDRPRGDLAAPLPVVPEGA